MFRFYEIRLLEKNVHTSQFWTGKPNSCNHHIYHFHVLESPHLDFFQILGVWRGGGYESPAHPSLALARAPGPLRGQSFRPYLEDTGSSRKCSKQSS